MWKQVRLVLIWALVVAPSCADDPVEQDPRLGALGRVKFNGGGGCNSSTTLAAGSTAKMKLEVVSGTLPDALEVSSTRPEVIEVVEVVDGDADVDAGVETDDGSGDGQESLVLRAVGEGETRIELHTHGALLDWLGFDVDDARSATTESPQRVFEGGRYVLEVKEIYGSCGEECPLIGADFMAWEASPNGGLEFIRDEGRRAEFTAGVAGATSLVGTEPVTGAKLIEHAVTTVSAADAGPLVARITVDPPGEDVREPESPPVRAPVGSYFVIALSAEAPGGEVPIFGGDIVWTLDPDDGPVARPEGEAYYTAEGPIFEARAAGTARLIGRVELLDTEIDIEVQVRD